MTITTKGNERKCPACGTEGIKPDDKRWDDVLSCPDKKCRILRYFKDE